MENKPMPLTNQKGIILCFFYGVFNDDFQSIRLSEGEAATSLVNSFNNILARLITNQKKCTFQIYIKPRNNSEISSS